MKQPILPLLVIAFLLVSSCEIIQVDNTEPVGTVEGVRPLYAPIEGWDSIISLAAQPVKNLGKIYYKDQFIYINERNRGIHVINNTNPLSPQPLRFIQVPGSEDIAIKDNILYADNVTDLVAIDISDLEHIKVASRVKDLYRDSKKDYPDGYNGYFECVDNQKGIVIGWEEAILDNPACFR